MSRVGPHDDNPPPDHYDGNPLVTAQFKDCPDLTEVRVLYSRHGTPWQQSFWNQVASAVRAATRHCYVRHAIRYPGTCGLYVAGSEEQCAQPNRDRMVMLVFPLFFDQLNRWRSVHNDLVEILEDNSLHDERGVCIRYYSVSRRIRVPSTSQTRASSITFADDLLDSAYHAPPSASGTSTSTARTAVPSLLPVAPASSRSTQTSDLPTLDARRSPVLSASLNAARPRTEPLLVASSSSRSTQTSDVTTPDAMMQNYGPALSASLNAHRARPTVGVLAPSSGRSTQSRDPRVVTQEEYNVLRHRMAMMNDDPLYSASPSTSGTSSGTARRPVPRGPLRAILSTARSTGVIDTATYNEAVAEADAALPRGSLPAVSSTARRARLVDTATYAEAVEEADAAFRRRVANSATPRVLTTPASSSSSRLGVPSPAEIATDFDASLRRRMTAQIAAEMGWSERELERARRQIEEVDRMHSVAGARGADYTPWNGGVSGN